MIAKQIKGQSFSGVLKYMDFKVKQGVGEMLDSNLIAIESVKSMAKEFNIISSLRSIKNMVYHASLSIQKDEGLSNQKFYELGTDYKNGMGFKDSQFVIYRHVDRDHPHIHIIANRVDMSGKVVSDKWDYKRSEKLVRELEKKYGLKPVVSSKEVMESSLSKGQVGKYKRTGEVPIKTQLQIIAKDALNNAKNLTEFEQIMAKGGAEVKVHYNSKGNSYGISFMLENVTFKGSSLGKGYSINKINEQLSINYERNKCNSQSQGGGKSQNIGRTDSSNSADQYLKYSRIENRVEPDNKGTHITNIGYKVAGSGSSGQTAENFSNQPYAEGTKQTSGGKTQGNEATKPIFQSEGIHVSDLIGNIGQFGSSNSNNNDEIDKKNKKIRKRKIRRPRP